MSYGEWFCGLCGTELGDDCIRVVEDDPGSGFCYVCAEKIAQAFLQARGQPREVNTPEAQIKFMSERLDALEDLTGKVASVWRLWLNDAEKGRINPGTFDAMKTLLGIEG